MILCDTKERKISIQKKKTEEDDSDVHCTECLREGRTAEGEYHLKIQIIEGSQTLAVERDRKKKKSLNLQKHVPRVWYGSGLRNVRHKMVRIPDPVAL